MSTSTSLGAALASTPPRAKRARPYTVKIRRWSERPGPVLLDVTMPDGLILRGCEVRGEGEARRVRAPGFEFVDRAAKDEFNRAVLAALDAKVQK